MGSKDVSSGNAQSLFTISSPLKELVLVNTSGRTLISAWCPGSKVFTHCLTAKYLPGSFRDILKAPMGESYISENKGVFFRMYHMMIY